LAINTSNEKPTLVFTSLLITA